MFIISTSFGATSATTSGRISIGMRVSTGLHYPYPVHAQPGLAEGARIPAPLTVTETVAREVLTLPLFPSLSEDQQARVITSLRSYFGKA